MDSVRTEQALQFMKEYFRNFDSDFFLDIRNLYTKIKDEIIPGALGIDLSSQDDFSDFIEEICASTLNETEPLLDFNETIAIVINFFNSINPTLGDMFQNLLRSKDIKFKKFSGGDLESDSKEIYLTGTYYDVVQIVHEFVHNFSNTVNNISATAKLIGEVDAISYELMAAKYVEENYNVPLTYIDNRLRLALILDYASSGASIDEVSYNIYLKFLEKNKYDYDSYMDFFKSLPREEQEILKKDSPTILGDISMATCFLGGFGHEFGYLIANYLISQNNLKGVDAITRAMSTGGDIEEYVIDALEKLDIPIFYEGKISLKGGNSEKLYNALYQSLVEQPAFKL